MMEGSDGIVCCCYCADYYTEELCVVYVCEPYLAFDGLMAVYCMAPLFFCGAPP